MHETLKEHKVQVFRGNGTPLIAKKVRPNDPCPCGSGKKSQTLLRHKNKVL